MYRYVKHGLYLIFSWLLQDVNYDESANFKPQRNAHNMNIIQHGSYDYRYFFFFLGVQITNIIILSNVKLEKPDSRN